MFWEISFGDSIRSLCGGNINWCPSLTAGRNFYRDLFWNGGRSWCMYLIRISDFRWQACAPNIWQNWLSQKYKMYLQKRDLKNLKPYLPPVAAHFIFVIPSNSSNCITVTVLNPSLRCPDPLKPCLNRINNYRPHF